MATQNGIGYSPLTEKVYMGRQNEEKRVWIGDKTDITNQFLDVAHSYFEKNTVRRIATSKSASLFIHIGENEEDIARLMNNLASRLQKLKSKNKKKAASSKKHSQ